MSIYIEQLLPPEPTFPTGLRCGMSLLVSGFQSTPYPVTGNLAALDCRPLDPANRAGVAAVSIATAESSPDLKDKLLALSSCDPKSERANSRQSAR